MSQSNYILPPFDTTAYPTLSGAQLYQFGSGLQPQTDIGFSISTTDVGAVPVVPDANTYPALKQFLWKRNSATAVGAYLWNDAATSDPTYLKWVSINIAALGVGVIVNSMIADNTITDSKIVNLDYSKLIGVPVGFTPSGAAGGDLTGTYPNPSVATSSITTAKIADLNVTTGKINDLGVTFGKIAPAGVGYALLRTNAGATAAEWVDAWISQLANPASAADVGKVVTVANPYTNKFTLAALNTIGGFDGTVTSINGLNAGTRLLQAHGLSATPKVKGGQFVCTSADLNWSVGDTIDSTNGVVISGFDSYPCIAVCADATNVWILCAAATSNIRIPDKTSGTYSLLNTAKWSFQINVRA